MTQIFLPQKSEISDRKLYCYHNQSSKTVIARIHGIEDRHCERVVFSGDKFLFRANDSCQLEISQQTITGIIQDSIPCSQLQVVEPEN